MKILCLFIFLSGITVAFAQPFHLQGSVVDVQTNRPIAAATISIVEKSLFYPADDKGKFEIISDKITRTDSLLFSCVGYQAKKIKVDDMLRKSTIELVPTVNILNEVKVNTNLVLLIKVGSRRKTGYEHWFPQPGGDMATFMEGSKNVKGIIQSVGFFLTKGHGMFKGGDVTAPFRVRLFGVDTNGMPGKELTTDSIVVPAKKEWSWFDVDISSYHIQNPDSGFFVSFCLLDYTHYKPITRADTNITSFSGEDSTYGRKLTPEESGNVKFSTPRICLTSDEFRQPRSYFYGYDAEDNRLHWEKFYDNQSFMIRAAIAPD